MKGLAEKMKVFTIPSQFKGWRRLRAGHWLGPMKTDGEARKCSVLAYEYCVWYEFLERPFPGDGIDPLSNEFARLWEIIELN